MVKVGQQGQVYLDSFPKQPLLAKVTRVDPKASFTPENTKTELLRCLASNLKDPQGLAKLGMPADGRIVPAAQPGALLRYFALGFLMTQIQADDSNSASKPLRSQSAI